MHALQLHPDRQFGHRTRAAGLLDSTLYNCIVYYNTAPDGANYDGDCTFFLLLHHPAAGGRREHRRRAHCS